MKLIIHTDGADILAGMSDIPYAVFLDRARGLFEAELAATGCFDDNQKIELSLLFTDAERIAGINREYRGIDSPTDVLSFPMWEEDRSFRPPEGWKSLPLGDLAVCPDAVAANAAENRKNFVEELVLVLSHGLLHLIGYDHDTEELEKIMWAKQDDMVRRFFLEADKEDDVHGDI